MAKILEGHKKIGQKFVPPLLQISSLHETSFVNQLLPEIIWIALIKIQTSSENALLITEFVSDTVADIAQARDFRNFGVISNLGNLSENEKERVLTEFQKESEGNQLLKLIQPLLSLYPECPLKFLNVDTPNKSDSIADVKLISDCVALHIDRFSKDGMIIQSIIAHLREYRGGTHYPPEIERPDFKSFAISPNMENLSIHGRIRIHANMELAAGGNILSDDWARYFWNNGILVSECEFDD